MDFKKFSLVTSDSRQVCPGALFVAVSGTSWDGHDFIDEVVAKGAAAIIGEKTLAHPIPVPYHQVKDSRRVLAQGAAEFFGKPSHTLKIAGVTGTSGKTTTTYILESILHAAGFNVGVIGTVNFRFGTAGKSKVLPSTHTTPGPVELQSLLAEMKAEGVSHVVMEVSSHALRQKRVNGIEFDVTAFTNLSPEHLDFHKDMEDYFSAKKLLFTELFDEARSAGKDPVRVINLDDPYGARLVEEFEEDTLTFGFDDSALFSAQALRDGIDGITGQVASIEMSSGLMGRFNILNLLTAIAMARGLGVSEEVIGLGIRSLSGVPGRLERVLNNRGFHIFVDYAHKPDALEKVLQNLQAFRGSSRLITVFGCGGDRDRTKRPVMGAIAARLSDWVIVTSDNPRTEDPQAILREILSGMQGLNHVQVEPDRRKAIFSAVAGARPGDLILIAGKGHEDYQVIGTQKFPFDDRKVVLDALG